VETYYNIGMAVSDKSVIFKYVLGNKQGKYVIRLKRIQIWRSHPMFKAYIQANIEYLGMSIGYIPKKLSILGVGIGYIPISYPIANTQ
jgi:hypothetical protein